MLTIIGTSYELQEGISTLLLLLLLFDPIIIIIIININELQEGIAEKDSRSDSSSEMQVGRHLAFHNWSGSRFKDRRDFCKGLVPIYDRLGLHPFKYLLERDTAALKRVTQKQRRVLTIEKKSQKTQEDTSWV